MTTANLTRDEATKVANNPEVASLDLSILVVIEIIYYSYQLWKACYAYSSEEYLSTYLASNQQDGSFSSSLIKKAEKRVKRAARHKRVKLSDKQLKTLTIAALSHVATLPSNQVAACCNEDFQQEVQAVYSNTPDDDETN